MVVVEPGRLPVTTDPCAGPADPETVTPEVPAATPPDTEGAPAPSAPVATLGPAVEEDEEWFVEACFPEDLFPPPVPAVAPVEAPSVPAAAPAVTLVDFDGENVPVMAAAETTPVSRTTTMAPASVPWCRIKAQNSFGQGGPPDRPLLPYRSVLSTPV